MKYSISWNDLKNANVVFGQKERPEGYTPAEITMNGKKYIVRLIRAYDDETSIIDRSSTFKSYDRVKGSEWNRLILPLIDPTGDDNNTGYSNETNGRYGSSNKNYIERNMPTLANYSWWTDFGGNNNSSGKYDKGNDYGVRRWAQETGYDGPSFRAYRGSNSYTNGAGNADSNIPRSSYGTTNYRGWLPVLELVN